MLFNSIVAVDNTGIRDWAIPKLQAFAQGKVTLHSDYPQSDEEILDRIGDAECVLVSWNTRLGEQVLRSAPNLKYVGMCCSLFDEASSNVHIPTAREKGIEVKGIFHYGDEGMVEFILSELIVLAKGLRTLQWKSEPVELTGRNLGIIGLGTTGKMLMKRAQAFGMKIYHYSRNRKPDQEAQGAHYRELSHLLKEVEILSLHLPRNTQVLGHKEFAQFGNGKVLVNTSLGLTFDKAAFLAWMEHPDNYAILDGVGLGGHATEFSAYPRIIFTESVSGWTLEAKNRLSQKVLDNIASYKEHLLLPK